MPRTSPCAVSIERLKIVEETVVASTSSKNADSRTNKESDKSQASELIGQVSVVGDNHYTTLRESTGTGKQTKSDDTITSASKLEKKTDSGMFEENGKTSPSKELVLVDDEKTLISPPRVTRSNERSLSRGSSSSTVSGGPQDSPARGSNLNYLLNH